MTQQKKSDGRDFREEQTSGERRRQHVRRRTRENNNCLLFSDGFYCRIHSYNSHEKTVGLVIFWGTKFSSNCWTALTNGQKFPNKTGQATGFIRKRRDPFNYKVKKK